MKNLLFILSLLLLVATAPALCQEKTIKYFDKHWFEVTSKQDAAFYRTVESASKGVIVRDYYISGKLQMMAECSSAEPKMVQDGKTLWYYESGALGGERYFADGKDVGIYKSFYENGNPEKVVRYDPEREVYVHWWSATGEELLSHGKGIVHSGSYEKSQGYLDIEDSVAVASFGIADGTTDTVYTMVKTLAEFRNKATRVEGLHGLAQYLQSNVVYPKEARRKGKEGVVFVAFVVDTNGAATGAYVVKGFYPACDEEALRVVSAMDSWIPAKHRGRAVKSKYIQPVKFRLN